MESIMRHRTPRAIIRYALMSAYEKREPVRFNLIDNDEGIVCSFAVTPVLDGDGHWSWATWMPMLGNVEALNEANGRAIEERVVGVYQRAARAFEDQLGLDVKVVSDVGHQPIDMFNSMVGSVAIRPEHRRMGSREIVSTLKEAEVAVSKMMPMTQADPRQNRIWLDIVLDSKRLGCDQIDPITMQIFLEKRAGLAPGYVRRYVQASALTERHRMVFGDGSFDARRMMHLSRLLRAIC